MDNTINQIRAAINYYENIGASELAAFFNRLLNEILSKRDDFETTLDAPMPLKIDKVAV